MIDRPDRACGGLIAAEYGTMNSSNDPRVLQREMSRVFAGAVVNRLDDETCKVLVSGWPDAVRYHAERAVLVLRGFEDGAGSTEAGDAAVCRALELAGAYVDTANREE